jgi:hypothetical protein
MSDDEMRRPCGDGTFAAELPFFGGMRIWDANPKIVEKIREAGNLLHAEKFTQLHALLAAQDADHLPARRRSGSQAWMTCPGTTGRSRPSRCARRRSAASITLASIRRGASRGCTR